MAYDNEFKQKVLKYLAKDHTQQEAFEVFGIGTTTVKTWKKRFPYARARRGVQAFGAIELTTPRDRNATFEPALIKKGQRRFTSMDDKILALKLALTQKHKIWDRPTKPPISP